MNADVDVNVNNEDSPYLLSKSACTRTGSRAAFQASNGRVDIDIFDFTNSDRSFV